MIITSHDNLTKGSEKRVQLKCDSCAKITETSYANYYNSCKKRNSKLTYCRKCSNQISGKNKRGKVYPHMKKPKPKGENSKSWKGGVYTSSDGYKMVYIGNQNGKSKWSNYRKEHLIIAEEKIGRPLKDNEIVHHIDGNKLNNNPDNLDVLSSESKHREAHNSLIEIALELVKSNYIKYNNGVYTKSEKLESL